MELNYEIDTLNEVHKILAFIAIDLLFDVEHLKEVDSVQYATAINVAMEIVGKVINEIKEKNSNAE
jgi:hypothetical protein